MQQLKSLFQKIFETRPKPKYPLDRSPKLPAFDDAESIPPKEALPSIGVAEGQTFAIEYESASGDLSERRISVWGLKRSANGIPNLVAKCHERNALRQFRIDRILCIIDLDGEIHEPPTDFLIECFGMDPVLAEAAETGEVDLPDIRKKMQAELKRKERWNLIKGVIYWDLKALAGLAWSDGEMHVEERGAILDHLHSILRDVELTAEEDDRLYKFVKRQHPSLGAVERAVDEIWKLPDERIRAFVGACARLIEADGRIDQDELSFLENAGFQLYH